MNVIVLYNDGQEDYYKTLETWSVQNSYLYLTRGEGDEYVVIPMENVRSLRVYK